MAKYSWEFVQEVMEFREAYGRKLAQAKFQLDSNTMGHLERRAKGPEPARAKPKGRYGVKPGGEGKKPFQSRYSPEMLARLMGGR